MEQEKEVKSTEASTRKKKKGLLVLLVLLLLAVIVFLSLLLLQKPAQTQPGMREANAMIGQFQGKTEEEIQAELNRVVEKGMFNISINPDILMESGESEAEIRVENVPGNQYLMGVTITLDDTGEEIYRSGLIEPNHHVQKIRILKVLSKGTYEATALFTAYEPETEAVAGTAAAKVSIIVRN